MGRHILIALFLFALVVLAWMVYGQEKDVSIRGDKIVKDNKKNDPICDLDKKVAHVISKRSELCKGIGTGNMATMPTKDSETTKTKSKVGSGRSIESNNKWVYSIGEINSLLKPEFELTCDGMADSGMDNLSFLSAFIFASGANIELPKVLVDLYMAREKSSDICSDREFEKKLNDILASKSYGTLLSLLRETEQGSDDYVLGLERTWNE